MTKVGLCWHTLSVYVNACKYALVKGNLHKNSVLQSTFLRKRKTKERTADFLKLEKKETVGSEIRITKQHEREHFSQCLSTPGNRGRDDLPRVPRYQNCHFLLFSTTETGSNRIAYGNCLQAHVIQLHYKGQQKQKNQKRLAFSIPPELK